jgi:hypothetical protein
VENWQLDLAVTGVAYVDGDPAKGAKVTVQTRDKLVAPSVLEVRYADGSSRRVGVAVETWELGGTQVLPLAGGPAIASVTIDPDHVLPDRDRSNNTFRP